MAVKGRLSRLERVPLRECWDREDADFTPWLAQESNIALLGEALRMELEVHGQEMNIGPFRADILCRNTEDNTLVIIENQLETTDHGHLGQLLTYSAGLKAGTLVWIAQHFTEEHRAAMDWLNERTDEGFQMFGLEIELWRIGDGPPAPKFNLVVKPNDWTRSVRETSRDRPMPRTAGEILRVEYWTAFGAFLREHGAPWKPPKPYPSNWVSYGLGRSGVNLLVVMNQGEVAIGVDIKALQRPGCFRRLLDDRVAVERELGFMLDWDEKPGGKTSTIRVRKPFDMWDKEAWPQAMSWTLEKLDACARVFRPRVRLMADGSSLTAAAAEQPLTAA